MEGSGCSGCPEPWHRVEVFNSLRQLTRHPEAQYRVSALDARAIIHLIEQDVRCDYLQQMEADWRDVLRTANEVSIAHAFALPCRAADLLHVAYALECAATLFVSFDGDQLALAKAAGLETAGMPGSEPWSMLHLPLRPG